MTHIEIYQSELDRFAYYPENTDEETRARPYRFNDLMHIADDDLRVATLLYWQCCDGWAYPETYHQANLDEGEYWKTGRGMSSTRNTTLVSRSRSWTIQNRTRALGRKSRSKSGKLLRFAWT